MGELPSADGAGLKTAVAEAMQSVAHVDETEQLPLLPLRQVGAGEDAANEGDIAPRGAGRPKGAQNRNTEAWRQWILKRYPSPLQALAEVFSRSIADLAKELGRDNPTYDQKVELLKLQLQCAKELAPYVHSKQPLAVDVGGAGLMQLIINTGMADKAQVDDAGTMKINLLDNQDVIEAEEINSVAANSVVSDITRNDTTFPPQKVTDTVSVCNGGQS